MNDTCVNFSISQPAAYILHNLSICCNCTHDLNRDEGSLLTLAVQVTRALVTLLLLMILLLCYSTLRVLGRTIINCTATCVIPWIIFFGLYALKSLTVAIFIGIVLANKYRDVDGVNQIGFIIVNCLQSIILMVNSFALNHEWYYRSPDYVDNPPILTNEGSWVIKLRHLVCRFGTIFICQAVATLLLLVAVEVQFKVSRGPPIWLVYIWLIVMLVQRATICVMGVMVCTQRHNKPTILAKVLLLLGLLFLIVDDLPNSLLATGDFCSTLKLDDKGDPCYIPGLAIYDIFQMMGLIGTVFILLFIRDQYVRIEEECKHHLLWDLERLLDVNTQERNDLLIK